MPTQLTFKGKSLAATFQHAVPVRPLLARSGGAAAWAPPAAGSIHLIDGNELYALKALSVSCPGGFDLIYASPNYNTGAKKDPWHYVDDIPAEPMLTWRLSTVPVARDDLERHEKWLCMMIPRLQMMHTLLAPNGVLLVSIDDNELFHLKCMLDEVFGADNFLANMVWEKRYSPAPDAPHVGYTHECILAFRKGPENGMRGALQRLLPRTDVGDTDEAAKELRALVPKASANVKPTRLLLYLLKTFSPTAGRLLVPFDDGGTAALAVVAANSDPSSQRSCVLLGQGLGRLTSTRLNAAIARQQGGAQRPTCRITEYRVDNTSPFESALGAGGLPTRRDVAQLVFHMATGLVAGSNEGGHPASKIGVAGGVHVYLLYEADAEWLASRASGLDMKFAESAAADARGETAVIFATTSFVSPERLEALGLRFSLLPSVVFRALKGAAPPTSEAEHAET